MPIGGKNDTTAAHGNAGNPSATVQQSQMGGASATSGGDVHGGSVSDADLPGPARHTAGPHKHDILNKLDPTVDSQSGGTQVLAPGIQGTAGTTTAGTTADNMTSDMPTGQAMRGAPEGNYEYAGPQHSSRAANELDLRIDSTTANAALSDSAAGTAAPVGRTGAAPEGSYGPHSAREGNALDPRVNSDRDKVPRDMASQERAGYGMGGSNARASDPNLSASAPYKATPPENKLA
ncbi:hypothetical protein PLIIFM63780_002230 [Purpureocillium lilacinum]|nr:hypothetical protein PLIIFM63780_002230 [Purpureocillium lilacinum]